MENLKMFQSWTILASALNMLILLPIWILNLGKQLSEAKPVYYDMAPNNSSSVRITRPTAGEDMDEYNSSQRELLHRNGRHESDENPMKVDHIIPHSKYHEIVIFCPF